MIKIEPEPFRARLLDQRALFLNDVRIPFINLSHPAIFRDAALGNFCRLQPAYWLKAKALGEKGK
jgi:hypothetical protein